MALFNRDRVKGRDLLALMRDEETVEGMSRDFLATVGREAVAEMDRLQRRGGKDWIAAAEACNLAANELFRRNAVGDFA
jgi:hypothetical protein